MNQLAVIAPSQLPALISASGERAGQPADTRTTRLYDRRAEHVSLDDVEKIGI